MAALKYMYWVVVVAYVMRIHIFKAFNQSDMYCRRTF